MSSSNTEKRVRPREENNGGGWSVLKVAGAAGLVLGGVMFVRNLTKGTAPTNLNTYNYLRQEAEPAAAKYARAHHATYQRAQSQQQQQQDQHRQSTQWSSNPNTGANYSTHSTRSDQSADDGSGQKQYWDRAQKEYEDAFWARQKASAETNWKEAKSDFEKYEDFLRTERENYFVFKEEASRKSGQSDYGSAYAYFVGADPTTIAFEMGKNQARADYIASKYAYRRRSKMVKAYRSWNGGRCGVDRSGSRHAAAPEQAEEPEETEQERQFDEQSRARRQADSYEGFTGIERQLMYSAKHIEARQLLFANYHTKSSGSTDSSDSSADAAAAYASSNASSRSSGAHAPFCASNVPAALPPLTIESVKNAYRQRALACHPDVKGGNSEEFRGIL